MLGSPVLGRCRGFLAGGTALASLCAAQPISAADMFALSSTTFKDGSMMPKKVGGNAPRNPNCVGENIAPQLSWTNPPAGTTSYVLLMEDPEGRGGTGVHHWVAYGIPMSITGFDEGEASKVSDKYIGGKSSLGAPYYLGPCLSGNVQPHHYMFMLVATDLDPKELPPGMTREEILAKIVPATPPNHAKGVAAIVGLFVNPPN